MHDASAGTRPQSAGVFVPDFQPDGQHILFGNRRAHTEIEHAVGAEARLEAECDLPCGRRIVPQGIRPVIFERTQHAQDQRAAGFQTEPAGVRHGPFHQVRPADHETGARAAQPGLVATRDSIVGPQFQRFRLFQKHRGHPCPVSIVDEDGRASVLRYGNDFLNPFGRKNVEFARYPGQDRQRCALQQGRLNAVIRVVFGQPGAGKGGSATDRRVGSPGRRYRQNPVLRGRHGEDR